MPILKRTFGVDTGKFFITLLLSFVAIQIASWFLSEVLDYPMLKTGWILLLFLVVIGIIALFMLGKNITQLTLKKDGLFILIIFGLIILAFIYLPKYLPTIFSATGFEIREFLRETIGTAIQLGGTGVTG